VARPRRQPRPIRLNERELAEGEELTVYRIVKTDDQDDPALINAFCSRAELGLPPRRYTPEAANPRINEGVSAYTTFEAAAETARTSRERGRDLGGFVASVRLMSGQEFKYALWGATGHLTIFGAAVTLCQAVTDIVPIEEPR